MSAPETYTTMMGEIITLADVPEVVRQVAVTIAFVSADMKWWEAIPAARECVKIARGNEDSLAHQAFDMLHWTCDNSDHAEAYRVLAKGLGYAS